MLEPDDGKLSSPVLRGLAPSNGGWLLGQSILSWCDLEFLAVTIRLRTSSWESTECSCDLVCALPMSQAREEIRRCADARERRASLLRCGRSVILISAQSDDSIHTGIFRRLPVGSMTQIQRHLPALACGSLEG